MYIISVLLLSGWRGANNSAP